MSGVVCYLRTGFGLAAVTRCGAFFGDAAAVAALDGAGPLERRDVVMPWATGIGLMEFFACAGTLITRRERVDVACVGCVFGD